MSFESTVLGLLRGDSDITGIVPANRIFFGQIPRGTGAPFIGCFRVSTRPSHTSDNGQAGAARLDNIIFQITIYASTEVKAHEAADAIRGVLEAYTPLRAILTDQTQTYDDPTELQGQILTFSCWYAGASPS